jgi:hypothetical protein
MANYPLPGSLHSLIGRIHLPSKALQHIETIKQMKNPNKTKNKKQKNTRQSIQKFPKCPHVDPSQRLLHNLVFTILLGRPPLGLSLRICVRFPLTAKIELLPHCTVDLQIAR